MKIPTALDEFDKLILKFIYKSKRPRIMKTFLKEEMEEEEKRKKRSSSMAWENFCETVVTETLILMQVSTN